MSLFSDYDIVLLDYKEADINEKMKNISIVTRAFQYRNSVKFSGFSSLCSLDMFKLEYLFVC